MQTRVVTIFVARSNGKFRAIGPSRDDFLKLAKDESEHWEISVTERTVPVVLGEVVNAESGEPHVFWKCPHCDDLHITDLEEDALNPSLWLCVNGEDERHACL